MPQRPAFNSGQWSQYERRIRKYAEKCTQTLNGKLYLLTGTSFAQFVPDYPKPMIAHPTIESLGVNPSIDVPNSMWTAGCCKAQDHKDTQNFAVIGNNVVDPDEMHTQQITVELLQNFLSEDVKHRDFDSPLPVSLFPGNWMCSNEQRNVILPPSS